MAKVVGPLFSLAASGTYRDEFVFRTTAGTTYVSKLPKITKERSMPQLQQQQKVKEMQLGWWSLTQSQRNIWAWGANQQGLKGYTYFWREWFIQGIVPPNVPIMP